ncbi:MAG: flippase-like domain-containing protein [Dehalococcoidales bacterium]|nr:flippase-like domain-containing protein [Dehalococcoidales bacterium]
MNDAVENTEVKPEADYKPGRRSFWGLCLRILICVGILWFVFSRVDLSEVYQLLKGINVWAFLLALLLFFIATFLFTIRWGIILRNLQININLKTLISLQFIGLFFNLFLPTSAGGDVIKAYYLSNISRKRGMSYLSIFLDRYIGLISAIIFAAIASLSVRLEINGFTIYYWILLIFIVSILLSVLLATNFARRINKLLGTRLKTVQGIISMINESSKTILKNPKVVVWTFLLSAGYLLLLVAINYIFIISIGQSIDLKDLFVFLPVIALLTSIPISINGLGLREGAYIYLFSTIGFTNSESLSISLLNFVLFLISGLPGALFYLLSSRKGKHIL